MASVTKTVSVDVDVEIDFKDLDAADMAEELLRRGWHTVFEHGDSVSLFDDDDGAPVDDEMHDMAEAWKLGKHPEVLRILHGYLQDRLEIILP